MGKEVLRCFFKFLRFLKNLLDNYTMVLSEKIMQETVVFITSNVMLGKKSSLGVSQPREVGNDYFKMRIYQLNFIYLYYCASI